MKRPRRAKARENAVKLAIDIFERDVEPKYNSDKRLSRLYLHKQPSNKYHKIFFNIVEYLDELREHHKNPIEHLIRDYLTVVFEYFKRFERIPTVINFSPSAANKIRFEEWIYEVSRESQTEYWIDEIPEIKEIIIVPYPDSKSEPTFLEV